jgi:hypothetical protein
MNDLSVSRHKVRVKISTIEYGLSTIVLYYRELDLDVPRIKVYMVAIDGENIADNRFYLDLESCELGEIINFIISNKMVRV